MTDALAQRRWAVCADAAGPDAAVIRERLMQVGAVEPRWFAPRDAEELDQAVREGAVDTVLLPDAAVLLTAMLDGLVDLQQWDARNVRVEFLRPPTNPRLVTAPNADLAASLTAFARTWSDWSARQRRHRTIAGLVLSFVAIASATAIVLLAGR